MQRKFKYGNIQNITFASDKKLNILTYRTPSYAIICRNCKLLNMVRFWAHPECNANRKTYDR